MKIEITESNTNITVDEHRSDVIEVNDFISSNDPISRQLITAAGELLVGLNPAVANVVDAPAGDGLLLVSDTALPRKMAWTGELVAVLDDPGDDTSLPTEKAVRDALDVHAAIQTGIHGLAITAGKTLTVTGDATIAGDPAPAAKGVTNGDSHNHDGGDGGQVDHTKLSNIGTNTHAQIDTFIAGGKFVPLTASLTAGAFDGGDAFSTTAKTLIDLSAAFNAPAGVKAILVHTKINDSGSLAGAAILILSPTNDANEGPYVQKASGFANDYVHHWNGMVPCDANGDIYYQITASGAGTLDAKIEIWGYWI